MFYREVFYFHSLGYLVQTNYSGKLPSVTWGIAIAGTVAILHSYTPAQLTKGMSLTRKNEEAAANLQESKRLQLVYKN